MDVSSKTMRPEAAALVKLTLENGEEIPATMAVLKMGNINLLLGNDTLRRCGGLTINYQQREDDESQSINCVSWARLKRSGWKGKPEKYGFSKVTDHSSEV